MDDIKFPNFRDFSSNILGTEISRETIFTGKQNSRETFFTARSEALSSARSLLERLSLTPTEATRAGLAINQDGKRRSAMELAAHPQVGWSAISEIWPEIAALDTPIAAQMQNEAVYHGYLDRQEADVLAFRRDEGVRIPADFDYRAVGGLSHEVREKLERARPATLGQAGRVEGVTPGALTALLAHVKRLDRRRAV